MDGRIFHIKEKLSQNLGHSWCVEEMAESVGLSIPHFIKLFKQEIKIPPHTYICELRLEKAKELVVTTFLHIQEVCTQVGIQNESHFTRDFKKKFGLTPTEYRKQQWEIHQSNSPDGQE